MPALQADVGRIFVAPKVEVGYLEQTAVSGSTRTVWEEARSRMTDLIKAEDAMAAATAGLERGEAAGVPRSLSGHACMHGESPADAPAVALMCIQAPHTHTGMPAA